MVFHEITRPAIERALEETRQIDVRLVDAQETRRILDRLYGYEVSPVLWKKITSGLSAGRVQSVATRLVVERERERMAFVRAAWWDLRLEATTRPPSPAVKFWGNRSTPCWSPWMAGGSRRAATSAATGGSRTRRPPARRDGRAWAGRAARRRRFHRQERRAQAVPPPAERAVHDLDPAAGGEPQASASPRSARCRSPSGCTRTATSPTCAPIRRRCRVGADGGAHAGERAVRPGVRTRPAPPLRPQGQERAGGARGNPPGRRLVPHARPGLARARRRRAPAVRADLEADARVTDGGREGPDGFHAHRRDVLRRRGRRSSARRAPSSPSADSSPRTRRAGTSGRKDEERKLPHLSEGDALTAAALEPQGHETTPPPRYTEATLVRALEERGIGRPSTYAAIIGTILDRGYVFKKDSALVPTFSPSPSSGLLEQHFGRLVDYDFTARMEDDLDRIAAGDEERVQWLRRFYYGNGDEGLKALVSDLGGIDAREVSSIEIGDGIVVRVGRYGPYLERDGRRASVPATGRPRRADGREGRRAPFAALGGSHARCRPRNRPRDRRAHWALRPVRDGGAG